MKLNIILNVLGLFFIARVRSEIGSYFKARNPVSEAANAKLEEAMNLLKEKINEQNKAIELGDKLQQGANEITNRVYASVKKTLHFLEEEIIKATAEADAQGIDVTKCKKMSISINHAIFVMMTNSSKCLNEKLSEGKELVDKILRRTQIAITDLTKITMDASMCFKNATGIKVISGFGCLSLSGLKASWAVTKHAPSVAFNIKRFTSLISNLHTSMIFCINKKAVSTLAEQSATILENIKQCAFEKVRGDQSVKNTSPMSTALQLYNPNDKLLYEQSQAYKKKMEEEDQQFTSRIREN